MFLTARDSVEDRWPLTAGGNNYVTKPFSLEEVVARLRGAACGAPGRARSASSSVLTVRRLDEKPRGVARRRTRSA